MAQMKKAALIFSSILVALIISGCSESNDNITGASIGMEEKVITIEKLEIYHFHGNVQCYSCKVLGDYARETVETYFKDELDSGIIVFAHINGEKPENRELVMKYGVTGSSLWLGVYDSDGFSAEENINVWYRLGSKERFMEYLRGVILEKLAGM
jgi:hypothetical protein